MFPFWVEGGRCQQGWLCLSLTENYGVLPVVDGMQMGGRLSAIEDGGERKRAGTGSSGTS